MDFSDFSSSIVKLKNRQISLEKNENEFIKYIKTNCDIAIEDEYNHLKNLSDQELHKIRNDMVENFKALQNIKSIVVNENVEKLDLHTLKNTMLSFENNLQNVREKINSELVNLSKTENALNIDIINTEIKLSDINKKVTDLYKATSQLPKNILEDEHIYQEVKDYTIFLTKSGGHEGGWSEDDHAAFIKMFNKYKNKKKIATQVHRLLPDKSNEEIMVHLEWYETYLELKNKQKEAIEKWKQSKNTKEEASEDTKQNDKCDNKSKIPEKRPEEKEEIKEKLKQWKLEKEQKLQQFLQGQMQNSSKVKNFEKQKRLKQVEKKKEIHKWKSTKAVKERADKLEKEILSLREKEKKTSLANKLIREYQCQDNVYISRRLSKLRINVTAPSVPTLKTNYSKVDRDPDRIFKATQQWVNRITPEDRGSSDNIFARNVSVKRIPKLAVPEWRKVAPKN